MELVGKMLLSAATEREEEDAGRFFVETMDDANSRIVGAGVGDVQMSGDLF